ncbi:Aste57867_21703 [Aphanomyces stellatus]|uniref:Aste57867_21703 protein n=1 Tax=Aphanomyces stellatus TaxID=120398 RepID=A0A485LI79_9STRA|nr:hypothetical protein As57867_021634 [Aphanomyces stellatus]VFT98372.1 Aste57867_21703 [Aphanomyces stellatus]
MPPMMETPEEDRIRPRHLTFLTPEDDRGVLLLSLLSTGGKPRLRPTKEDTDEDAHPNQERDEGLLMGSPFFAPSVAKRMRTRRTIMIEEEDGEANESDDSDMEDVRMETRVVILKQPPSTWHWRDSQPIARFDMEVGLVALDNPNELVAMDAQGGFTLWLLTEDGNGVFEQYELKWTARPSKRAHAVVMRIELTADGSHRPKDNQRIKIHVNYTNSKTLNSFPMDSNDIFVCLHPLYDTPLSPILPTTPSNHADLSSPDSSLGDKRDAIADLSLGLLSPFPSFTLDEMRLSIDPSAPDMAKAFASAPVDFIVRWACAAATVLSAVEALPVADTLLNECPICHAAVSLELPMSHTTECLLHNLLSQVSDCVNGGTAASPWPRPPLLSTDDQHSLMSTTPTSLLRGHLCFEDQSSLSRDLSLLSMEDSPWSDRPATSSSSMA